VKHLQGEMLDKKLAYWKDKLADVEPIQLPIDFERPSVQSIKGANVNFKLVKNYLNHCRLHYQNKMALLCS
jgi:hypothetical protein